MMEQQLNNSSEPELRLLGGMLSMEFSDCSIAAADLSRQVHEKLQGKDIDYTRLYTAGEDTVDRLYRVYSLGNSFTIDGVSTQLMLAQGMSEEAPVSVGQNSEKRRWLSKRVVEAPVKPSKPKPFGNPILAAEIARDTLLPLATFALRTDGNCSYVQLGQEMEDDNFYVTTGDDETNRFQIVEALRELTMRMYKSSPLDKKAHEVIQKFLDNQAAAQHEILTATYEKSLVRKCFAVLKEGKERTMTFLQEDGPQTNRYITKHLTSMCVMEDGRLVQLGFVSLPGSDTAELGLTTRGSVSVSAATLFESAGKVDFKPYTSFAPQERHDLLRELLRKLTNPVTPAGLASQYPKEYKAYAHDKVESQIIASCVKAKCLSNYELSVDRKDGKNISSSWALDRSEKHYGSLPTIAAKLSRFFVYPAADRLPFPDSAPLQLAFQRLEHLQKDERKLISQLQLAEKLAGLGEVRACDELLMYYAGILERENVELTATFRDVQIGKTKGDARVSASVKREGQYYNLQIAGRPLSMPHEPMKQLTHLVLDPTQPYLGQAGAKDRMFSQPNVAELVDILSQIVAGQSTQGE